MSGVSSNVAARVVVAEPIGEVPGDVAENVDARDVHRAERRALWPADGRAGDRVDLLDRVLPRLEHAKRAA